MNEKSVSKSQRPPPSTSKLASENGSSNPIARVHKHPADEEAWDVIDEAARDADAPDAAEAVYLEVLERDDLPRDTRRIVGQRAVQFLEEWYDETEKPIGVLKHCIVRDASNAWALEKLSLLLTLGERWDDLLGIYDQTLGDVADKAQRIHLLEEAARIAKDFAGQANRASDYLKQLLLLRPEDTTLASSLERRLEQQERFADLVEIWRARLPVVAEPAATELRLNIARTLLEPLGEAAAALQASEELLADGRAGAATCELIDRIAAQPQTPLLTKRAALAMLERTYAADGRVADTIPILRRALEIADTVELRGQLYAKLVQWLEVAEDSSGAQLSAAEWLSVDPSHAEALAKLESLAEQTGDQVGFANALVRAGEAAPLAAVRIQLLTHAARTFREKAEVPHSATELYARVLLDPESELADKLLSARQLRELLTSPAQIGQRLDVLERSSALEPVIEAQSLALREAAQLAEKLGDDERALRLWSECLEREPSDELALDSRIEILSRCERWPDLLEAYRARTTYPADDAECRADWVAIASLYEHRLQDPAQAIDTWRRIEQQFGRSDETVDALYTLCCNTERWQEAATLLRSAAQEGRPSERPSERPTSKRGASERPPSQKRGAASDRQAAVKIDPASTERRVELLARLGDVLRAHLREARQALTEYQKGLELSPTSSRCREGVRALLLEDAVKESAAETLATALRTAGEWRELLELLETRLEVASNPEARQAILSEAAQLNELQGNDARAALLQVQRAFEIAADAELEQKMLRLAVDTGDWAAAVMGYQRALVHCRDAVRTTQLLMEQGRIEETKLGDWNAALTSYRRVVELEHAHLEGACAVIRCAGRVQRWHDAAWAFIECSRHRGTLEADLVGSWSEVAAQNVGGETSGWTEALAELEATLRDTRDIAPVTSHDVKFQLAIWQHERRGARELAEALLEEAVTEHRAVPSLQLLSQLQRVHPSRSLVTSLLQLSKLLDDPLPQLDEAARVALEVVGDSELARPILANALSTAEHQLQTENDARRRDVASWCVDRLVEIALTASDHQEAFTQLTHATQIPFEPERLWDLKHRAALIAAEHLDQPSTAIALCEDVLAEQPERITTVQLLARLYEQRGKLAPLVTLLRRELELPRSPEHRLAVRLELSRVLGLENAPAKERVSCLLENLEETPGDPATVEALTAVLMDSGRATELYGVLCAQADLVNSRGDGPRATELYARAGHLARQELKDDDAALVAFRHSVALSPGTRVLDALADIHTLRAEHDDAVLWLKQRLDLTSLDAVEEHRATRVRLGGSLEAAGRVEEAVLVLRAGLERDPAANEVRALLITLEEGRRAWPELATLLADGVPFLTDPSAQVDYLSRAATVRWHELGDVAGAVPLLEQAVQRAPEDRKLRLWLSEASRLAGLLPRARDLLNQLLDEFGRRRTPERAQVHFQLALIDRAEGTLDAALEHLDAASNIARGDASILRTLGDVAREKGELERAETAYRALLLLVGRGGPSAAPSTNVGSSAAADPGVQGESAILYELYKIAREKNQQERARDLLDSAIEKSEHPAEAAVLEQTLRDAEEWELLHQALERRQSRVSSSADERALTRDRADVLMHLGRNAEALELRLNLLAMDPTDADALEQAAVLAERSRAPERFRHAVIDLAEKLDPEQPELSCQFWLRLGKDAEVNGDLNAASNFYERAQLTGKDPAAAFEALRAIHEQTGDMHGLTLALQRFVEHGIDSANATLVSDALFRLAEIELCSTALRDSGLERLEDALRRDPQQRRALEILTTSVEVVPPSERMLAQLEELARATGDRPALCLALYHSALLTEPTLVQLKEAVDLAQELGQDERGAQLLLRTVEVARGRNQLPEVTWALVQLAERARRTQRWNDAREFLSEAIKASSKKRKVELQLELADLLTTQIGDLAEAAHLYEKLAQAAPGDPRIWKPLVALYRQSGEADKLEACLGRAEDFADGDEERRALRLERVRLMIDEERLRDAEEALRETVRYAPQDVEATDLLVELLERQSRTAEVQQLVADALTSATDARNDEATVRYAIRLGAIHEAAGEADEALAVLREAQAVVHGNPALINAVLRLLPESEQEERANLLESLLPAKPAEEAGPLAVQLAELRAALGDDAGQERAMEVGFKASPTHSVLRERLEAWYRERDHWGPLVEHLVLDAKHRATPEEAIPRYLEAARIYDERLSDAFAAGDVLLRALELDPLSLQILEPLTHHLTISGRADQAALALTTAIEDVELPPEDLPLLFTLRAAARGRLDPRSLRLTQEAITDLDSAMLLGRSDCEEALVELLERQRELSLAVQDEESERGAVLRLAELLPQLQRSDDAIGVLAVWVDAHPDDLDAVRRYAALAVSLENWTAAAEANLALFELTRGEERLNAGLAYAAAEERRGAPLAARPLLERLHAEAPGDERVAGQLRAAYEAAGSYHELATLLLSNAEQTTDTKLRQRLLIDAGELFVKTGEPHAEALDALREALRLDPQDHRATLALARALTLHSDIEGACNALGEAMKEHGKRRSPQLAELQYGMAQIAELAGDDEGRFAWLDAALQSDRKNGVVASEFALLAMEREDYDNAVKALQLITLLKEDCPMSRSEAYLRQGQIASAKGDPRKAALLAKRALTADTNYEPAKIFLEELGPV